MPIRLVVGLGNPGEAYADTRHNVGFRVVDELVRRAGAAWSEGHLCHVARVAGEDCGSGGLWLAKPQTYMNRSGDAVRALIASAGAEPSAMLVVLDDVDLPLGRLRLRRGGGPGTHNGLRDIVEVVGEAFPRLRVGVRGHSPWHDLAEYVLAPFDEEEQRLAEEMVGRAADGVETVLADGVERAMNTVNRRPPGDD